MKVSKFSTLRGWLHERGESIQLELSPTLGWPEPEIAVDDEDFSEAIANGRESSNGWVPQHSSAQGWSAN